MFEAPSLPQVEPSYGLADASQDLAAAASSLAAAVDRLRAAAGATPREPTPLEQLGIAVAAARAEMGHMDSLFTGVLTRLEVGDFTPAHVEALNAWAIANAALFAFTRDVLSRTNEALAHIV